MCAQLIGAAEGQLCRMANQTFGCRVVQKFIPLAAALGLHDLVCDDLREGIGELMADRNGNHVVQRCVDTEDPVFVRLVVDSLKGRVQETATHMYGCRVIQVLSSSSLPLCLPPPSSSSSSSFSLSVCPY